MSGRKNIKGFPQLSDKLAAPAKKSLFERQKEEAEAKRRREQEETAAVLEDFVKSFDEDGEQSNTSTEQKFGNDHLQRPGPRLPTGPQKRHFIPSSSRGKSGPGTLGPPPPSRKRPFEAANQHEGEKRQEKRMFAFEDSRRAKTFDAATAFKLSDDEDESVAPEEKSEQRAVPKPTVQLSSLPPGTTSAMINKMLSPHLEVDHIRIMASTNPSNFESSERKSQTVIVTLAMSTPASDIDLAVNALQNRYLGWGYYLSLSRYLSSSALESSMANIKSLNTGSNSHPFGARPIPQAQHGPNIHRGGYAPPSSYNAYGQAARRAQVQVNVVPPGDLNQLRLIHKTVELITVKGVEFESALMSRRQVQKEEKWSWIWDARSRGGVYYRWCLWKHFSRTHARGQGASYRVFNRSALWVEPDHKLPFQNLTKISELVTMSDYDTDEDEAADEMQIRRRLRREQQLEHLPAVGDLTPAFDGSPQRAYLTPAKRARFIWQMYRLPPVIPKLTKRCVAAVSWYAIKHSGPGSDEMVDLLVRNVLKPFSCMESLTSAWARAYKKVSAPWLAPSKSRPENSNSTDNPQQEEEETRSTKPDMSVYHLNALYCISDVLGSSPTSGVAQSWRYRSLFQDILVRARIFYRLGRLEKRLGMGRLRAERWRASLLRVIETWKGWSTFEKGIDEIFVRDLEAGISAGSASESDKTKAEPPKDSKPAITQTQAPSKSKWMTVDAAMEARAKEEAEAAEAAEAAAEKQAKETQLQAKQHAESEAQAKQEEKEKLAAAAKEKTAALKAKAAAIAAKFAHLQQANKAQKPTASSSTSGQDKSLKKPGESNANVDVNVDANVNVNVMNKDNDNEKDEAKASVASTGTVVPQKRSRPKAEDMFADSEDEDDE